MDFGEALEHIKDGGRVSRAGWNGSGVWLLLIGGSTFPVAADRPIGQADPSSVGVEVVYRSHIDMKTVDGSFVPWVASQSDLLAEDWYPI